MNHLVRQFAYDYRAGIAALLVFGFYAWIALVWHSIDTRPPRWDESHNLMISQHSYQALQRGDVIGALCLKDVTYTKPGMVSFLSALSYFVIGDKPRIATFVVNASSMLVVFLALLKMSVHLFDRVDIGVLACFVFACTGSTLVWTGYYQGDLAMVAAVCGTVALCVAIDRRGFSSRRLAVLLALFVAAGISIKHLYVVFAAGPLAALVLRAVLQSLRPLRVSIRGRVFLLSALVIAVGLGVAYHILNIHIFQEQLARSRNAALTGGLGRPPPAWTVIVRLIDLLPPLAWLSLLAVSTLILALRKRWHVAYLLLSMGLGYVGTGYVASFPVPYYFMPMLPLGFLVACGAIAFPLPREWKPARVIEIGRCVVVVGLILLLVLQYSTRRLGTANLLRVAWNTPRVLASAGEWDGNPFAASDYWSNVCVDGNRATLPYPHRWPVKEMLDEIAARIEPDGKGPPAMLLHCAGAFEWMTDDWIRYELRRRRLRERVAMGQPIPPPPDKTPEQILADYDFLIMKTGLPAKRDFQTAGWHKPLQDFVDQLAQADYARLRAAGFSLIRRYALPDGSEGTLWKSARVVR